MKLNLKPEPGTRTKYGKYFALYLNSRLVKKFDRVSRDRKTSRSKLVNELMQATVEQFEGRQEEQSAAS